MHLLVLINDGLILFDLLVAQCIKFCMNALFDRFFNIWLIPSSNVVS